MNNLIFRLLSGKTVLLFIVLTLCNVAVHAQPGRSASQKINSVMEAISYSYVDSVNEQEIAEKAIKQMLKELDPHSVYISAREMREMNEPLVGNFEGVGIQFNILSDTIMVTATIPGGPSEKTGIRAGDKIVTIDGEIVAKVGFTNNDVIKRLRGDKGTKVQVGIFRRGVSEILEFTIVRDKIPLFSVDAVFMAAPEIGYVKVNRFAESTTDEFKAALKKVKEQGAKHIILDLTGNGGGYMNRAVEMADEFLSDNKLIVYTHGRSSPRLDYKSTSKGAFVKGKVVVMIDEGSASASEIVSGALQDWDRALVIGRRSFGKGLVQKPINLYDGSGLRLTTARYYTPVGRSIQKPYEEGSEEYNKDLLNRLKHGELSNKDSIHFDDSLRYLTPAKRAVYGGGGIMPDLFIPIDTSMTSKYYSSLIRKGVLNQFALTYVDNNRSALIKQYPDAAGLKKGFSIGKNLMDDLIAHATKEGVEFNADDYKISENLLTIQLKALIARNLFDLEAYYLVINDINNIYQKAIEVILDKTFEQNKIVSN
jgi:carboxyl-terminal processing protease